MNLDQKTIAARDMFMAIAVFERHQLGHPTFNHSDICLRLYDIWMQVINDARSGFITFEVDSVLSVNHLIAKALKGEPSVFQKTNDWSKFLEELRTINTIEQHIKEDPGHTISWIFSQLYWHHISSFRLSTVFIYTNAIRILYGLEENRLILDKLGPFLDRLSGAGPPLSDGQHFYPSDPYYSRPWNEEI